MLARILFHLFFFIFYWFLNNNLSANLSPNSPIDSNSKNISLHPEIKAIPQWPVTNNLYSIIISGDGNNGWAVGENNIILHYSHKDTLWYQYPSSSISSLNTLYGISMSADWKQGLAVGDNGTILYYNSKMKKWIFIPLLPNKYKKTLYCVYLDKKGNYAWIGGKDGLLLLLKRNILGWKIKKNLIRDSLNIYSISIDEVSQQGWAVGENGLILKFNGEKWSKYFDKSNKKLPDLRSVSFKGKYGWIVGDNGICLKYNNNLSRWEKIQSSYSFNKKRLNCVLLDNNGTSWVCGNNNSICFQNRQLCEWQSSISKCNIAESNLNALCTDSSGNIVMACGNNGRIMYYNKQERIWKDFIPIFQNEDYGIINSLWFNSHGNYGWAATSEGFIIKYCGRTETWNTEKIRGLNKSLSINDIWMYDNLAEGWAVGDRGLVIKYEYRNWYLDKASSLTRNDLNAIYMNNNGDIGWAVGREGTIINYGRENSWYNVEQPYSEHSLYTVFTDREGNNTWAAGDNGILLHYNNTLNNGQWIIDERIRTLTQDAIFDLWFDDDAQSGWVIGNNSTIIEYSENCWTRKKVEMNPPFLLKEICMDKSGNYGWIIGSNSTCGNYNKVHSKMWNLYKGNSKSSYNTLSIPEQSNTFWIGTTDGEIIKSKKRMLNNDSINIKNYKTLIKGRWTLHSSFPIFQTPAIDLVDTNGKILINKNEFKVTESKNIPNEYSINIYDKSNFLNKIKNKPFYIRVFTFVYPFSNVTFEASTLLMIQIKKTKILPLIFATLLVILQIIINWKSKNKLKKNIKIISTSIIGLLIILILIYYVIPIYNITLVK